MTPKGHAIPSKTQLLSYGTPAFPNGVFSSGLNQLVYFDLDTPFFGKTADLG